MGGVRLTPSVIAEFKRHEGKFIYEIKDATGYKGNERSLRRILRQYKIWFKWRTPGHKAEYGEALLTTLEGFAGQATAKQLSAFTGVEITNLRQICARHGIPVMPEADVHYEKVCNLYAKIHSVSKVAYLSDLSEGQVYRLIRKGEAEGFFTQVP